MEATINDRIESIVNHYCNGNKASFAKSIGIAPTLISSYLGKQRRSKPNIDMVAKIIKIYDVDARWLITGEESENIKIKTTGNYSPATAKGNASVFIENNSKEMEIEYLKSIVKEKDERIKELKERIDDLKKN